MSGVTWPCSSSPGSLSPGRWGPVLSVQRRSALCSGDLWKWQKCHTLHLCSSKKHGCLGSHRSDKLLQRSRGRRRTPTTAVSVSVDTLTIVPSYPPTFPMSLSSTDLFFSSLLLLSFMFDNWSWFTFFPSVLLTTGVPLISYNYYITFCVDVDPLNWLWEVKEVIFKSIYINVRIIL